MKRKQVTGHPTPYLSRDALFCIVSQLPVSHRLPLRVVSKQMERAVNCSITSIAFTRYAPHVDILAKKFFNLQHVTIKRPTHFDSIYRHNRDTLISIRASRFFIERLSSIKDFPLLENLCLQTIVRKHDTDDVFLRTIVGSDDFSSQSLQKLCVHGSFVNWDLHAFASRFPSLKKLHVPQPYTFLTVIDTGVKPKLPTNSICEIFARNFVQKIAHLPDNLVGIDFANFNYEATMSVLERTNCLRHVSCSFNRQVQALVDINIRTLTKLRIWCVDTGLYYKDTWTKLLSNNPNIEKFQCGSVSMDYSWICPLLRNCKYLYLMSLMENREDDVDAIISNCQQIETLFIGAGILNEKDMFKVLKGLPRLQRVKVGYDFAVTFRKCITECGFTRKAFNTYIKE